MFPPQITALLGQFKSPLVPLLLGLVLLAKKQPEQLHGLIDYLGTFYDFVIQPENAAGLGLVVTALLWFTKQHGNTSPAFTQRVGESLVKIETLAEKANEKPPLETDE